MSVKPWQKATLSMMAGTAVYAGVLYSVTKQMQEHNQTLLKQRQAVIAEDKQLQATFQTRKTELLALEKKLQSEQASTAKVEAQIKAVNQEIAEIKAGHIPGAPVIPSPVSLPPASSSIVSVSNIQPPPVQTVTKAS